MDNNPYVLGHTSRERDRLDVQGHLYAAATRRAFRDAGIEPGMHVLDVGCGSGAVTRLAAELVGPAGRVHGIDRDTATVEDARSRSQQMGFSNVRFSIGDMGGGLEEGSVDAVVGRFVLMHQPNPIEALARTVATVRSEGIVVFIESHMLSLLDGVHSHPRSLVYDELIRWKCQVVRAAGADVGAGLNLRRIFREAGLPEPSLRLEAPVVGGPNSPYYRYMAESVRSMLPQARDFGIDGMDPTRVDRIEHDLRDEVVASGGVLVTWPVVAAWSRRP